jgi:16S rRNA (cytosine967-C5)-methyltransferase
MESPLTFKQINHICNIVKSVMEGGFNADRTINFEFRNNQISNETDRAIIADTSYEVVRYWRLLLEIQNNFPQSLPVDYFHLVATWFTLNNYQLPASNKFKGFDPANAKIQYNQLSGIRKIQQSVPDWLDQLGYDAYAENWDTELHALNEKPKVFVRVNRLKIKPSELLIKFQNLGYQAQMVEKSPDAIMLDSRTDVFSTKLYKEGYYEVQDAGSQLIASYLDSRPGMRVADACAGNGGKTLHLASLMQNKGKIIALDIKEEKLKNLKNRVAKAGVDIVETRHIESSKTIKRLESGFDRVLLDVPCSGTGALRHNPEIKWRMNPDKLSNLLKTQSAILGQYSQMVKKNGLLVYATCSILPSENNDQVASFLAKSQGQFELVKEQFISPSKTGFDGFYMAQILRK